TRFSRDWSSDVCSSDLHLFNPMSIARLQHAVRTEDEDTYADYARRVNDQTRKLGTLRGLLELDFDGATPIPLDEVEPWTDIVKRSEERRVGKECRSPCA